MAVYNQLRCQLLYTWNLLISQAENVQKIPPFVYFRSRFLYDFCDLLYTNRVLHYVIISRHFQSLYHPFARGVWNENENRMYLHSEEKLRFVPHFLFLFYSPAKGEQIREKRVKEKVRSFFLPTLQKWIEKEEKLEKTRFSFPQKGKKEKNFFFRCPSTFCSKSPPYSATGKVNSVPFSIKLSIWFHVSQEVVKKRGNRNKKKRGERETIRLRAWIDFADWWASGVWPGCSHHCIRPMSSTPLHTTHTDLLANK